MRDHAIDRNPAALMSTRGAPNEHAEQLRARLMKLRQNLARARANFNENPAAQIETNEQLLQAALNAQTIAETAISDLAALAYTSQRDTLTDTPNRALVLDRLERALALARRHQTRIAVLFLDLDDFKQVNDTFSHAVGDQVLQLVARRLESVVRDSDTVSRYGGEEFLVLLPEIAQPADAALIAQKMGSELSLPSSVGEHVLRVSASIGISIYPEDGEDAATLIHHADLAMYRSKKRGSGGFEFHHEEVSIDSDIRSAGVDDLHDQAIDSDPMAERAPSLCALRGANEQVVVATLSVQELELHAAQARCRQIKFLGMVAHELRNPLSPLQSAAGLLTHAPTDESRNAELRVIIERQLAHMAQLIDDLLDESRINTGEFRLDRSSVDLEVILSQAVQTCRPAMDTKLQHLQVKLPSRPLSLHGDPVRLAQIFSNLLENASKYTPQGGHITLAAETLDHAVSISVSDNGMGIAAEVLPNIFELFVQGTRAFVFHDTGLGIGLAVVRELVEAHGGTVVGRSAGRDLGSEFIVTLPTAQAPIAGQLPASPPRGTP